MPDCFTRTVWATACSAEHRGLKWHLVCHLDCQVNDLLFKAGVSSSDEKWAIEDLSMFLPSHGLSELPLVCCWLASTYWGCSMCTLSGWQHPSLISWTAACYTNLFLKSFQNWGLCVVHCSVSLQERSAVAGCHWCAVFLCTEGRGGSQVQKERLSDAFCSSSHSADASFLCHVLNWMEEALLWKGLWIEGSGVFLPAYDL